MTNSKLNTAVENRQIVTPQRIQIKLFASAESTVNYPALIPVFHRWIQEDAVDGLLIDVADYKHVPNGPGVMLVGHEVDYGIDERGGRLGLTVTRKINRTEMDKSFDEEIAIALRWALQSADLLVDEPTLDLDFEQDEIELRFLDALRTPNNAETFGAIRPIINQVVEDNFGVSTILEYIELDQRRPLTVRAIVGRTVSLSVAA